MQSFVKIKSLRNGKITLSFTDICKSCLSWDLLMLQICLLTLLTKKIIAKISEIYSILNKVNTPKFHLGDTVRG